MDLRNEARQDSMVPMAPPPGSRTEFPTLVAPTAEAMRRLGARLGQVMRVGDVVGLVGPLGSGKTTFAQGMAEGLGVPPDRHIASPTFALVSEHPGRVTFVHADLYRIEHAADLVELGLEESYDRAAAAVEWLDHFPDLAPADHLEVTIAPQADESRLLTLRATGPRAGSLAAALLPTPDDAT
jgi:tRNA threonylcarbamoyladenosine biosynthesis protein TsaE